MDYKVVLSPSAHADLRDIVCKLGYLDALEQRNLMFEALVS